MKRWCFIIVIFPLFGHAQKFSAASLTVLKTYCTGVFTNEAQAKTDTHFMQSTLKLQPIWPKRKDGVWLFAEKTDTSHHYQVWHFYLQDDTTVLLQFLDFKITQQALKLSGDIKQQSSLYLTNLLTRQGCGLYLKKNKLNYTAASAGKDCLADRPGMEYITYAITFTKNNITWQQNDFDKEDKQSAGDVYNYIKQSTPLK